MMQSKKNQKDNILPIVGLGTIAGLLTALGVWFFVYALQNNLYFVMMNSEIPAVIFAAVVIFLGVRYCIATIKLIKKVRGKEFSWQNFRKTI